MLEIGTIFGQNFIFFKKHYGYFRGLKKTLRTFIISCMKWIWFALKKDDSKKDAHKMSALGLVNSYLLRPSSYRVDD